VTYFLTPEAEFELAEAVDFYALNASPKVARNFLALFEEKVLLLSEFPSMGTPTTKGRHPVADAGRYVPARPTLSPR
jgi:plasmid stabilization system protein ParE